MVSSLNYTKTSFQRCLFENILGIYITCTNTYYKHNTNFCYTVIIIKNKQNYQNSCCVIGSSVSVSWVLMILHCSDCLDCLFYYIVVCIYRNRSIPLCLSCRCILYLYNYGHNVYRPFDTLPNFFSPQVKRSMIISNQQSIYELSHELPNDLRLRILGN